MVELQGNMKKGSLKRFLAMFLVFCMSVSNFYVNESYAQAAESQETKWNATVTITSQDGKTTIKAGEKLQLSAKVDYVLSTDDTATPDVVATNDAAVPASNENAQKVIWTTSNDKVAAVVDGLVEGKAKGEAVITAASVLAPQKSASFKITVQEDDTQKPPVDDDKKPPVVDDDKKPPVVDDDKKPPVVDDDKKPPVTPPVSNKVTGVTLNKKSVSVNKGKSVKLTASVAPANAANKAVTWSSDKKNIATVDKNGNVKGIKKGTANITVTTKEGNFKAVCKVTVKVPATKVTVNVNTQNITLKKGKTANAAAYVTPSDSTDKISWSSKNKKVATVDKKGKIKAVKAGKTEIIAKAGKKSAKIKVTVVNKDKKAKKVTLNKKKANLNVKKQLTLKASINPKDSTDTLKWSTSNKKIATVDKFGVVTAKKPGTAKITVQAGKKKATCTVMVPGVTLKKTSATIKKGKTVKIEIKSTIVKNDKVKSYTSSNKKIATVDKKGKVKGIKKGKADITVTMKSGAKATFKVTVK